MSCQQHTFERNTNTRYMYNKGWPKVRVGLLVCQLTYPSVFIHHDPQLLL